MTKENQRPSSTANRPPVKTASILQWFKPAAPRVESGTGVSRNESAMPGNASGLPGNQSGNAQSSLARQTPADEALRVEREIQRQRILDQQLEQAMRGTLEAMRSWTESAHVVDPQLQNTLMDACVALRLALKSHHSALPRDHLAIRQQAMRMYRDFLFEFTAGMDRILCCVDGQVMVQLKQVRQVFEQALASSTTKSDVKQSMSTIQNHSSTVIPSQNQVISSGKSNTGISVMVPGISSSKQPPASTQPAQQGNAQMKKRRKKLDDCEIAHLFDLPQFPVVDTVFLHTHDAVTHEPTQLPISMHALMQLSGCFQFMRDFGDMFGIEGSDELELEHLLRFMAHFEEWDWFSSALQSLLFQVMPADELPEMGFMSMQALFAYFLRTEDVEHVEAQRLARVFESQEYVGIKVEDRISALTVLVDALCECDLYREHLSGVSKRVTALSTTVKPIKRKELASVVQELAVLRDQMDATRFKQKQQQAAFDAFLSNIETEVAMILDQEERVRDCGDTQADEDMTEEQLREWQERRDKSSRQRELARERRRKPLMAKHQAAIDEQRALVDSLTDELETQEERQAELEQMREEIEHALAHGIDEELNTVLLPFREAGMMVLGTDRAFRKYFYCPYLDVILVQRFVECEEGNGLDGSEWHNGVKVEYAVIDNKEDLQRLTSALNLSGPREKELRAAIDARRADLQEMFDKEETLWKKISQVQRVSDKVDGAEEGDDTSSEEKEADKKEESSVSRHLAVDYQQQMIHDCRELVRTSLGSLLDEFRQYAVDKNHLHTRLTDAIFSFDLTAWEAHPAFEKEDSMSADALRDCLLQVFQYVKPPVFLTDDDHVYANYFVFPEDDDAGKKNEKAGNEEQVDVEGMQAQQQSDVGTSAPGEGVDEKEMARQKEESQSQIKHEHWFNYLNSLKTLSALGFYAENLQLLLRSIQRTLRRQIGLLKPPAPGTSSKSNKKAKKGQKRRRGGGSRRAARQAAAEVDDDGLSMRSTRIAALAHRPKYEESSTDEEQGDSMVVDEYQDDEPVSGDMSHDDDEEEDIRADTGHNLRRKKRVVYALNQRKSKPPAKNARRAASHDRASRLNHRRHSVDDESADSDQSDEPVVQRRSARTRRPSTPSDDEERDEDESASDSEQERPRTRGFHKISYCSPRATRQQGRRKQHQQRGGGRLLRFVDTMTSDDESDA